MTSEAHIEATSAERSLDERKAVILRAVVDEHITTGQPVGSAHLGSATGLQVSSATIRNEMSALERDGYLTHPHTSAGRIPTDKGYRFFVDSLSPGHLGAPQSMQVRAFFDEAHGELERMLTDTSRLLSSLTDYAAVVVAPESEPTTIRSVQVVGLGPGTGRDGRAVEVALLVTVSSSGTVDKHTLELAADTEQHHLADASVQLWSVLVGRNPADPVPGECSNTGDPRTDAVCRAALASVSPRVTNDVDRGVPVFVGGVARMAGAFDALDTVRAVLAVLEQQYVVVNLLRDALDRGASVSIGAEHGTGIGFQPLLTCSVVAAPYLVDGRPAGTIGVLGPTRMNYPQAMAAVAAVSHRLSQRLTDG